MQLVLIGESEGRAVRIPLVAGVNRIDRGCFRSAGLRAPSVSRCHAEIELNPSGAAIRDLGSSNGTWVDGELVLAERPVAPGARLRFGDVELALVDEAAEGEGHGPTFQRAAAAHGRTPLAQADNVRATESISWDEVRSAIGRAETGDRALIRALSEASETLVAPDPLEGTLARLLDLVHQTINARRVLILLSEEGDPEPRIRAARPPVGPGETLVLSHTLVRTVLEESRALLLADTSTDERFRDQRSIVQLHLRSAMVAPLFDNTRVIGLLYADSDDPRVTFDRDQLRVFSLLANLTAVKITNTRLQEAERERELLVQQLHVAAEIQRHLLPETLPAVAGYELCARQIPCYEVGGDLYEAAALPDGRVLLAVGDVSGKGIGAALLMFNVMACLRVLSQEPPDLRSWIQRIHRQVLQSSDAMHFATLFLALLDPVAHRLEYASAGHDPVIVLGPGDTVQQLGATGVPAGMLPGVTFGIAAVDLPPGSLVAISTDGIREASRSDEEIYGSERIAAELARQRANPLPDVAAALLADVCSFTGAAAYDDDATLLLLRRV